MELRSELELYRMTVLRCSELVTRYPFFQSFENGISKFIKVLMHVIYAFALTVVNLVGPDGFEPSTQRLFVELFSTIMNDITFIIGEISPERVACSNQLSYGPETLLYHSTQRVSNSSSMPSDGSTRIDTYKVSLSVSWSSATTV